MFLLFLLCWSSCPGFVAGAVDRSFLAGLVEQAVDGVSQQNVDEQVDVVMAKVSSRVQWCKAEMSGCRNLCLFYRTVTISRTPDAGRSSWR